MNKNINRPLGFGEILDQTFRMLKSNFKTLFAITFLVSVPVLAIQAIILSLTGRDFFTTLNSGQNLLEQFVQGSETVATSTIQEDLLTIFSSMFFIFALPVLAGAIILTVKHTREGEKPAAKEMIKGSLPRYWPLFWSSVLYMIIISAILFPSFVIIILIGTLFIMVDPIIGTFVMLLLGLGLFVGAGLLFTRWSLYLPAVLFEKVAPGLGKSFRLTKRQTWKFFGLIIVLMIITSIISFVLQIPLMLLGDSVLFNLLTNLISMITSMIFVVGYSVMYFDASVRQEATDLKAMINEYDVPEQT